MIRGWLWTLALLAVLVSTWNVRGNVPPSGSAPGGSPAAEGVRALTGEELRFFNERFFNGAGVRDEYGWSVYSIRNQFANPMNLYEKPEDVDLCELFYNEGTEMLDEEEIKAVFGMEELPGVPAFKLTAEEINCVLVQYTGLTLEQTNQVNLEQFSYSPDYDAYYLMHGDTNYPGELNFSTGTREGNLVRLYQNSELLFSPSWYCVTLEEQPDGGWWFISNLECEEPALPRT